MKRALLVLLFACSPLGPITFTPDGPPACDDVLGRCGPSVDIIYALDMSAATWVYDVRGIMIGGIPEDLRANPHISVGLLNAASYEPGIARGPFIGVTSYATFAGFASSGFDANPSGAFTSYDAIVEIARGQFNSLMGLRERRRLVVLLTAESATSPAGYDCDAVYAATHGFPGAVVLVLTTSEHSGDYDRCGASVMPIDGDAAQAIADTVEAQATL